jgi:uncharacterized membrane protein
MSDGQPSTARIEAFSDGVIAIIITVMLLELKLPTDIFEHHTPIDVVRGIGPQLLSYVLSFVVVAIMLINHHAMMLLAPYGSRALYWWNAHLLFWMSLIPFATATMGDAPYGAADVAFYGVIMCANSGAFALMHSYVERFAARNGCGSTSANYDLAKDIASTVLYAAAAGLAYISVYISFVIFVGILVSYLLPNFTNGRPRETA